MLVIPEQIFKGCRQNDTKSQSDLYRLCHSILMRVGMRYANGDRQVALANVNMAFLKIIQNLGNYKETTPFEPWIRRIMINVCLDEFRKNKSYHATIQIQEMVPQRDFGHFINLNEAETRLSAAEVQNLIAELPAPTAHIFNLFAIDDFTHKEIAEALNITESASKWHVVKARNYLKERISPYISHSKPQVKQDEIAR